MQAILAALAAAVCYLLYNSQMFSFFNSILRKTPPVWLCQVLTFAVNFSLFYAVSKLGFYLVINWTLIAVFLILETALIYRCSLPQSIFCGLIGALNGLAVNIITRSAAALLTGLPMSSFDSRLQSSGIGAYYKLYPISAGFIVTGLLFLLLRRKIKDDSLLQGPSRYQNLKFIIRLETALFACLILNLMIYSLPADRTILKIWEMKTGLCALIGLFIGLLYLRRINWLNQFEQRSNAVRADLVVHIAREEELEQLAGTDALTGCHTRQYGEKSLSENTASPVPFVLSFIDIDNLKEVNDRFGHEFGDRYITAAVHELQSLVSADSDLLYRYGGDEFVLLLHNLTLDEAGKKLADASVQLASLSYTAEYPFPLSISYGSVDSGDYSTPEELLRESDVRMYRHKSRKAAVPLP